MDAVHDDDDGDCDEIFRIPRLIPGNVQSTVISSSRYSVKFNFLQIQFIAFTDNVAEFSRV